MYSSSKAASDVLATSYIKSFFTATPNAILVLLDLAIV